MELNRGDNAPKRESEAVNKVDCLSNIPLAMAKVKLGACLKHAIGDRAFKEFGDKGQISNVVSGEKAPDYLARIYQDKHARRRFALALLSEDDGVRVRTTVEWDEEKERVG